MTSVEPVKFLLVDDLVENMRALEALLRRDGLACYSARSGVEALELLLEHEFSLALLDVQMPEMNGFELAELMRGTDRTRNVPIIFITAVATDEGRRFRGYEAGAVDYVFKPVDPFVLKSKAEVFFEIGHQRQLLARQKQELAATAVELAMALDRLQAHTDNSPLALVEFDVDLNLRAWSNGAERMFGWSASEMVGDRLQDLGWVPDTCTGELVARFSASMADAAHRRGVEDVHCRCKDGSVRNCEWYISVLRDACGKPLSLSIQILDVSARHRAEETQRLLIGELNHRVKNSLASVQAIATQTLRHTRSLEQFSATFSGRIQALSRAHALLSDTTWQGADLRTLIGDQLKIGTIDPQRFEATGPDVQLAPQDALRLALVLHELVTNANKYGAFANASGQVSLSWSASENRLQLKWQERDGPNVKAPIKRGFGSTLIEGSIKSDGGVATASYHAAGVAWDIALRLTSTQPSLTRPQSRPLVPELAAARAVPARPIEGQAFLVVEDEALVALDIISILEDAGALVVGPAGTVEEAVQMIDDCGIDAAFLDGNLHGRPVDDVAALLTRRNIPFCFVSGYGREHLPAAFASAPVVGKPYRPDQLLDQATRLVSAPENVVNFRLAAKESAKQ